jgi:hypothetical protein
MTWPGLAGIGAVAAGMGFTVSLLMASLAFTGTLLDQAKLGVLAAAIVSLLVAWMIFRIITWLSAPVRAQQLGRTAEQIVDLADEVDLERDHVRGKAEAVVTLVEYGDFECPYCRQAERIIREVLDMCDDTCATSSATCRSATYTLTRRWRQRPPRLPVPKGRPGGCMICCSLTKTLSHRSIYAATRLIPMALAPALHEAESPVTPASRDGNSTRGGAECSANSRLSALPSSACVRASSSLPANSASRTSSVSARATRSGCSRARVVQGPSRQAAWITRILPPRPP